MKDVTEGMREKVDIVMLPHLEMFSIKIFASKKKNTSAEITYFYRSIKLKNRPVYLNYYL